ncbi:MAG: DUF433 domain-containing protein [Ktedonobacterales bacterium]|nr:DUF433 domain-containing protein [Ktedonobacterales bacterium]
MNDGEHPYVELREHVRYVRGSRVPLESLVWLWRDGQSAETIREAYPTLRLAEVYGALAYYLDHQAEVDQELADGLARFDALRAAAESDDPARYSALRQRFAAAREQQTAS